MLSLVYNKLKRDQSCYTQEESLSNVTFLGECKIGKTAEGIATFA